MELLFGLSVVALLAIVLCLMIMATLEQEQADARTEDEATRPPYTAMLGGCWDDED